MIIVHAILDLLFLIVKETFEMMGDFIVSAVPYRRQVKHTADFDTPDNQFKRTDKDNGFCIGTWFTSNKVANSHAICIAGTGGGKSTVFAYPSLLQATNCSFVIHDCSEQLFNDVSGALAAKGMDIKVIDYSNPNSDCFNVIGACKTREDLEKIIGVAMEHAQAGENDYWQQSARNLVTYFATMIWEYAPDEFKNIPNILHMLSVFSYAPERIDRWIVAHVRNEFDLSEYKSICSTPQKTLLCSLSTAKNALAVYASENIQKITSNTTFDFDEFRSPTKPVALFICNSPSTAHHFKSVSSTIIQSFMNHILEKPPAKGSANIMFMLDESAVLKIKGLSSFLSLSRKYNISVATLWQEYSQIESLYGKEEALNIFSNCNLKIFLPCSKPLATCTMLEKLLGDFNYLSEDGKTVHTRKLLTAQEIFQLDKILVLNSNRRPVLIPPEPFYVQPHLVKQTKIPKYKIEQKDTISKPPLLSFP